MKLSNGTAIIKGRRIDMVIVDDFALGREPPSVEYLQPESRDLLLGYMRAKEEFEAAGHVLFSQPFTERLPAAAWEAAGFGADMGDWIVSYIAALSGDPLGEVYSNLYAWNQLHGCPGVDEWRKLWRGE